MGGMTEPTAFYVRVDDDCYAATEATRGPWDAGAQHGGPPSALVGYAIEEIVNPRLRERR